jgi:glycosyltransferase involved in cell wall biosynthesis
MKIRYVLPGGTGGFSRFGSTVVAALHGAGHRVGCHVIHAPVVEDSEEGALVALLQGDAPWAEVNIINADPLSLIGNLRRGALNIGYTMFEATLLKPDRVSACNEMAGIIVPSTYCRETFLASGVTVPVHVVPPPARPESLPPERDATYCRFLSIFVWSPRKAPEALLSAYWAEFGGDEDVCLTLKTSPGDGAAKAIDEFQKARGARGRGEVEVIEEPMSAAEIRALHLDSDCYVSAACSEGWGMPQFQAMSIGRPVISTGYSGHMDFMESGNSYPVAFTMGPPRATPEALAPYYDMPGQEWATVDEDDLRAKMRHVFMRSEEARKVGLQGQRDVLTKFCAAATVAKFERAVLAIVGGR